MKRFICGFLVGAMLFGAAGAFAVSYIAETAGFKVLVNGREFTSDPPALVVDGRTFLPLRAIGDALGVYVDWDSVNGQALVGAPPATDENTRQNPAPLGTIQTYVKDDRYSTTNYTAAIKVLEVVRGDEAWNRLYAYSNANEAPDAGYECIIVKVSFSLLTSQDDKAVDASHLSFNFYSGSDVEYTYKNTAFENRLYTKLFVGGSTEGYVVGYVRKDDLNTKLVYGIKQEGDGGVWFNLK